MIRNDSLLRFQFKHGLNRLRMRDGEVLAGQPEQRPDISETTVDDDSDDSVRVDGDVPAAPEPDQIIPLVMYNQPWLQPPGQPAECRRDNDDAVSECEDMISGLSVPGKAIPGLPEAPKRRQERGLANFDGWQVGGMGRANKNIK